MTNANTKPKPDIKVRAGRFSISLWTRCMVLSNGNPDSIVYIEKKVNVTRACIQYSTRDRNTGKWSNQQIWFNSHEVRDIGVLLDRLDEAIAEKHEELKEEAYASSCICSLATKNTSQKNEGCEARC